MTRYESFPNGYALVVGVGNYLNTNLSVEATANDAEDIVKLLKNPQFCSYPENQVLGPLTNNRATKENIFRELDNLFEKTEEDSNATVLIFFSGHGWKENNEYYFMPHETEATYSDEKKEIESVTLTTTIANNELVNRFRKFSNSPSIKRLAIFFNTCFSGGLGTRLGGPVASSQLIGIPLEVYNNLLESEGRCIVTSSSKEESSWIKKGARNSIFTEQLIAGLMGQGSREDATEVKILDLCQYLSVAVKNEAKSIKVNQTPRFSVYQSENFPIAILRGGQAPYRKQIRIILRNKFDLEELLELADDIGIDPVKLNSNNKYMLARELIEHYARSGGLGNLLITLGELKPELKEILPDKREIPLGNQQTIQQIKSIQEKKYTELRSEFVLMLENWMLNHNLRNSKLGSEISDIATNHFREVINQLDEVGKSELIGLLYTYKLIGRNAPINLQNANLSGALLNKLDLTGIDLRGVNLRNASLCLTKLSDSNLEDADLREADLQSVNFQGANLHKVDLREANLRGADLTESNLSEARLEGADLREGKMDHANLRKCTKDNNTKIDPKWQMVWELLNNEDSLFETKHKSYSNADLSAVNLSNADLQGVNLSGNNLSYADLSGANLRGAILYKANLNFVNLSNADLISAVLIQSTMVGTNLENVKLMRVDFVRRVLNELSLRFYLSKKLIGRRSEINFMTTKVWGNDMADLEGAILQEANLRGAIVSPEQIIKVKEIKNTLMPDNTLSISSDIKMENISGVPKK